jgi:predicted nucleic acid-binding protein
VFGGVYDDKFKEVSNRFFNKIADGYFSLVISPVVGKEIAHPDTPIQVKDVYEKFLPLCEIAKILPEVIDLQQEYIREKILTEKWEDDALHVAAATVHGCDIIISWNFKHIVNFHRIPLYNAVNTLNGYHEIQIFSPMEVIEDE